MVNILDIRPRYGDVISNGIPGMAMPNMGADVTNKLRKDARIFAEAYINPHSGTAYVRQKADKLEGALMAVVTVGVLDEKTVAGLLEELQQLMELGKYT